MSFATALGNFDEIINNLKDQSSSTTSLLNFLKSMSDAYKQFYNNLKTSVAFLNPHVIKSDSSDSLYNSLDALRENITVLMEQTSKMYKSIREETLTPIDKQLRAFIGKNNTIVQQHAWLFKDYKRTLLLIEKHRQLYYKLSESIESTGEAKPKQDLKKVEAENINYKTNVKKLKFFNVKYSAKLLDVMKELEENEEQRRSIIKESLTAFQRQSDIFYSTMLNSQSSMRFQTIEPQSDIHLIVNFIKSKSLNETEENYIPYKDYIRIKSESLQKVDMINSIDNMSLDKPKIAIRSSILNRIFLEGERSQEDMDKLTESNESIYRSLDSVEGRWTFCMMLENREKNDKLSLWNLENLSGLIHDLLNNMVKSGDKDPEVFNKLIVVSHRFYAYNDVGDRVYMMTVISNHSIWKDQNRWNASLELLINTKLKSDKNLALHRRIKTNHAGLMISSEFIKMQKSLDSKDSVYSGILSIFKSYYIYMLNFNLPSQIAMEILYNSVINLGLPIHILNEFKETSVSISKESMHKKSREITRWGGILALKYAMEYLEEDDLNNMILVCKEWNSTLLKPICRIKYKKYLNFEDSKIREKYWGSVLSVRSVAVDYKDVLKKVVDFPELLEDQDHLIELDVDRSFHSYSPEIQDALKNILKAYAVYNPEIGYCQGMNYIAGTLYLGVNNEETAFKCMISLLEKYSMKHMYQLHHQILRLMFYQLDRCIFIFLPEMSLYLMHHEVHSFKYSSSWFITIFSQTLKYEEKLKFKIWDLYILEGWKAFFKIAIAIFSRLSTKLHEKNFDDIMSMISNLSSPELNQDIFTADFMDHARSIKITHSLLKYLEDEYLANPKKEYIKDII